MAIVEATALTPSTLLSTTNLPRPRQPLTGRRPQKPLQPPCSRQPTPHCGRPLNPVALVAQRAAPILPHEGRQPLGAWHCGERPGSCAKVPCPPRLQVGVHAVAALGAGKPDPGPRPVDALPPRPSAKQVHNAFGLALQGACRVVRCRRSIRAEEEKPPQRDQTAEVPHSFGFSRGQVDVGQ